MLRFLLRLAFAYAVEETCERLAPKGIVTLWLDSIPHYATVRKYNGTHDAAKRIAGASYPGWRTSHSGNTVDFYAKTGESIFLEVTST
jgi:hypothetical protein